MPSRPWSDFDESFLPRQRVRVTRSVIPPAPGDLRLVQDFLNTVDLRAGTDELVTPRSASSWLAGEGLLATGADLDAEDHRRVLTFREALRDLIAGRGSASSTVREAADEAVAGAALRVRFAADGLLRFEPLAAAADGVIGRLLALIVGAQRADLWRRFRICLSSECRSAFLDESTNRTSKWCRPRCGNRLHARAFRKRKKTSGQRKKASRQR